MQHQLPRNNTGWMFISPRLKSVAQSSRVHIATAYRNDVDLRMRIKMILVLSFVPIQDVPEAFENFRRHLYW